MPKRLVAASAVLALVCLPARAAEPAPPAAAIDLPGTEQIDGLLRRAVSEKHVTAALAGVWRGEREFLTAAGTSMTGVPATPDMHFRIGAVSITTLTTLLVQLADEGVVGLDDPLGKWFPKYPEAGRVTLRMLADSSAGYADYVTDDAFVDAFHDDVFADWSDDELIRIAMKRGMVFAPGTGFQYAHTNYILLGKALEAATGRPLAALAEARVLGPLGLAETSIWTTPALAEPVLHAFTSERGIFEESTFWNPSWTSFTGFLNSDLSDLGRLFRALASGKLISQEGYSALIAPTNVGRGGNTHARYYGMGIAVIEPWIMQNFSFGGYGGTVGYLPSEDLTLAVVATLGPAADPDADPSRPIFEKIRAALGR